MLLAKVRLAEGVIRVGILEGASVRLIDFIPDDRCQTLADILHAADPKGLALRLADRTSQSVDSAAVSFLAPIDQQEVWAAGVTYKRSQVARMQESESAASHYDKVYTAPRPEIFFKATPNRVAGPGQPLRVRSDSNWSVPEPELALVINPQLQLVGFTVGNDMSARDIEGENPLYLPQAKLYNQCCGLGPCVLLPDGQLPRRHENLADDPPRRSRCLLRRNRRRPDETPVRRTDRLAGTRKRTGHRSLSADRHRRRAPGRLHARRR